MGPPSACEVNGSTTRTACTGLPQPNYSFTRSEQNADKPGCELPHEKPFSSTYLCEAAIDEQLRSGDVPAVLVAPRLSSWPARNGETMRRTRSPQTTPPNAKKGRARELRITSAASRSGEARSSRRRWRPACAGSRRTTAKRVSSRALRREIKRKTQAEEAVGWSDNAQVACCGLDHMRIGAELRDPELWPDGCGDADRFRDHESHRSADEGNAQRPLALAGADIRAHECDERCAKSEDDGDQQIFQPCARAVAGRRARSGGAGDQCGGERDDHIRLQRRDRSDRSYPEDAPEQWPAQARHPQPGNIAPRQHVPAEQRSS